MTGDILAFVSSELAANVNYERKKDREGPPTYRGHMNREDVV
jgi:hypothetical protein